jgi:hypothetical protein
MCEIRSMQEQLKEIESQNLEEYQLRLDYYQNMRAVEK